MIRILLVEPMNLLRGALAATLSLEEDFEVVADLGALDQALVMARAVPPDVAVVNVALLAGDGLATIARLTEQLPDCATLALAGVGVDGPVCHPAFRVQLSAAPGKRGRRHVPELPRHGPPQPGPS